MVRVRMFHEDMSPCDKQMWSETGYLELSRPSNSETWYLELSRPNNSETGYLELSKIM